MSPSEILMLGALYVGTILAVAVMAWCLQPPEAEDEPTEFGATYDALAAQRDQVDEIKRKSHAAERLIVAQLMAAKMGRPHDPVEL